MSKEEQLHKLHEKWKQDCPCKLRATATQPVPGVGNADADIVFIGEAPGKDEDKQGEPFVGRAGKFLTEMLEMIGMTRDDVYITNTVKFRPPDNRDPQPEEVTDCWDWLSEELNLIQPKVIVMLGRHALERFFSGERISQVHGTILKKNVSGLDTNHFLALYHPAAALYKGDMREVLKEDFQKLPIVLEKIKSGETEQQAEQKDKQDDDATHKQNTKTIDEVESIDELFD